MSTRDMLRQVDAIKTSLAPEADPLRAALVIPADFAERERLAAINRAKLYSPCRLAMRGRCSW